MNQGVIFFRNFGIELRHRLVYRKRFFTLAAGFWYGSG